MSELSGFPLNGCDAFMLAMDYGMMRDGSSRNICHLLVTLEPTVDLSSTVGKIERDPTFAAVSRLRLSTRFMRTPRWVRSPSSDAVPAVPCDDACVTEAALHSRILSHSFDPRRAAPFGAIALPRFIAGPSLLFYWHHALCDAHGGESLVKRVVSSPTESSTPLKPLSPAPTSRRIAARRARLTKKLIFSKANPDIARLSPQTTSAPRHQYARVTFSEAQSASIDQRSRNLTGGMFPTALYLAATARALATLPEMSRSESGTLLIPVPHDMRRVTKVRSPLSNQVSVAFFALPAHQRATLLDATNDVIEQLHETIAGEHHHGMLDFFRFIRRLPSRWLWRVIEHPTAGHPASFYFSDIGSSLSTLTSVHGEAVVRASHYPPNLAPPGFTTVWSRYRGLLELVICYDAARLSEQALQSFMRHLNDDLLGATT